MRFEEFLDESIEVSRELTARSHQLASGAKSTEAEMTHDRAARRHQKAVLNKQKAEQPEPKKEYSA